MLKITILNAKGFDKVEHYLFFYKINQNKKHQYSYANYSYLLRKTPF